MNKLKCSDCVFYDQQYKFSPTGPRPAWYGWCSKKSLYPHRAPDGMVIPPDAERVGEDEAIAKPFIVDGARVITACTDAVKK